MGDIQLEQYTDKALSAVLASKGKDILRKALGDAMNKLQRTFPLLLDRTLLLSFFEQVKYGQTRGQRSGRRSTAT